MVSRTTRRGFTAFQLIVALGVLAIVVGLTMPHSMGRAAVARALADVGAIDEVATALSLKHRDHRATDAPPEQWIRDVADIAGIMPGGRLPAGLAPAAGKLIDRRGYSYTLTAETLDSPALLTRDS